MNLFRFGSMIAAALIAAAGTAAAQQPAQPASYKVGFVDMDRVLRDARVSQQAQQSLEAQFKKREQEIAAGPPGEAERRRNDLLDDIKSLRDDALKQVSDQVFATIRRVAGEQNLDAVFVEATYVAPRIDITDKVIKALDAAR
jgi:outer membrane protein